MPGLNNAAMAVAAGALQDILMYAQLHYGPSGTAGTNNVTTAPREAVTWGTITGAGDFDLGAQLDFAGGEQNGDVYSVTLWDAITTGNYWGEFVLGGENSFNADGEYTVSSLSLDGSAS